MNPKGTSVRKKQNELSFDSTTYKTTITFKGMAKNVVGRLGHSKSVIINALVTDALKSGKMADFLIEYFPVSRVNELLETIHPKNHADPHKKTSLPPKLQRYYPKVPQEMKLSTCTLTQENTAHNDKENIDGFDF